MKCDYCGRPIEDYVFYVRQYTPLFCCAACAAKFFLDLLGMEKEVFIKAYGEKGENR